MSIIRLDSKLPRIVPPAKLPNGSTAVPWSKDPYLEDNSKWATLNAVELKNYGLTRPSGKDGEFLVFQDGIAAMQPTIIYIECLKVKGCFFLNQAIKFPIFDAGIYLIDNVNTSVNTILGSANSYFTPDPNFNLLPAGVLPLPANTSGWSQSLANTLACTKKPGENRIHIDVATVNNQLLYNAPWTLNGGYSKLEMTVTVDYVPPGVELGIYYGVGTALSGITKPGTYTVIVNASTTGNPPGLYPIVGGKGEAIISRFEIKDQAQAWTVEGDVFVQVNAWWIASKAAFEAITNPQYKIAANQLARQNLAGQPRTEYPKIGYSTYLPPAGNYRVGDTIRNPTGQPMGWRCITAGNPGIWSPLASL
jgi:hypothetical protein